MPRIVICASPACCETVSAGTIPARPSTVRSPNWSSDLAESTVTAMGVDWMLAAPVFVAVTVTVPENEETASTKSSAAAPTPMSISVVRGSNPVRRAVTT
jgi:hypothetical protein